MRTVNRRFGVLVLVVVAAFSSYAADKPAKSTKSSPVREGRYACVFGFGGSFFDTSTIVIEPANRYSASNGQGTWSYSATGRQITFLSGTLARDFTTGSYVASGPVQGGLKNKKGPAMILRPSPAYKKAHGAEAVPLYCYLKTE